MAEAHLAYEEWALDHSQLYGVLFRVLLQRCEWGTATQCYKKWEEIHLKKKKQWKKEWIKNKSWLEVMLHKQNHYS